MHGRLPRKSHRSTKIPVVAVSTATTTTVAPKSDTAPPTAPTGPTGPTGGAAKATASINLDLGSALSKPSQSILIIILITVLSVAPALLIMLTSFTRIIIVLTLTRNALGVSSIPPNQVLVGLALFLSLFIMGPTFSQMNKDGIQPYINGQITQTQAYNATTAPLKTFMLKHVRSDELSLFVQISKTHPATPKDVSLQALIPAYILSEIKTAFIIGFVIFIPFLVIDIIVSSSSDVNGHDDVAAPDDLSAFQAFAFRARRWVGTRDQSTHNQFQLATQFRRREYPQWTIKL